MGEKCFEALVLIGRFLKINSCQYQHQLRRRAEITET